MKTVLFLLTFLTMGISENAPFSLCKGWNPQLPWYTLQEGISVAKSSNKILMVIISEPNCELCRTLREGFNSNHRVQVISPQFVMVNLFPEEVPNESKYSPDGNYTPRVILLSHLGTENENIYNQLGQRDKKHLYNNVEELLLGMSLALDFFGPFHKELVHDEL